MYKLAVATDPPVTTNRLQKDEGIKEGRRRRKGSEEERKGGNWLPQAKNYEFRGGKIILNMLKIKGKTKNRALNCRFFRLRRTTYLKEGKKTSNNLT